MRSIKEQHLDMLADYTEGLWRKPELRQLFLELTMRCNAHCYHCGSDCTAAACGQLRFEDCKILLDRVRQDFDISRLMLCITGGEPLLAPDFFPILEYANACGYRWGMTTNGTLVTKEVAHRLANAGMRTVSVSLDGLPATHNALRGMPNGFEQTMRGVQNLIDENAFQHVQITTVFNHENLREINDLFRLLDKVDIDSWRLASLEPIGRALSRPELMLTPEDHRLLFGFIREKRAEGYPLQYGCSHFLGLTYEAEVRDWYWLCNAGVYTASVMANGDIGACLDIERRPETVQGNIYRDNFTDVWRDRFEIFRQNPGCGSNTCRDCKYLRWCRGDARHSWNYDKNEPMVCFKGILFD